MGMTLNINFEFLENSLLLCSYLDPVHVCTQFVAYREYARTPIRVFSPRRFPLRKT